MKKVGKVTHKMYLDFKEWFYNNGYEQNGIGFLKKENRIYPINKVYNIYLKTL